MSGTPQALRVRDRRPVGPKQGVHGQHASQAGPALDAESQAWLERLRPGSRKREAAIAALHALLLSAARFEVDRRRGAFPTSRGDEREDLAQQSADDALVAVLAELADFRGASRFTTWAYKFALLEAASKVRRRAWQNREVPFDAEGLALIANAGSTPARDVEAKELFSAVGKAIERELTPHQRTVLVAVTLNDVPIDVLAERMNTTRGALYKTIHDARRRIRFTLAARELDVDEFLADPQEQRRRNG